MKFKISFCFLIAFFPSVLLAQDSDQLFQLARKMAFDNKDYPRAIALSRQALTQSPNYSDVRVFLGRLYTWTAKLDSARLMFEMVLKVDKADEDAALAYASLEYWNDNSRRALSILNSGLEENATSEGLLLLKAKVLNNLREYKEANAAVSELIKNYPKNPEARIIASRIKDNSTLNKIGTSYDFIYFDRQFADPWHLASVAYSRQTKIGSVSGGINYANRFNTGGFQFEVDAYPSLAKNFYAYVSAGTSAEDVVFPKYRAGFSLYASLPAAFEAEAGFRYLRFGSSTWIYTFSAGKYWKNYWFNLRAYLTPSTTSISQSYSLSVRYYFGGADDYMGFGAGTGISPDESSNVLLNSSFKLKSNNLSLGYRHAFKTFNVIAVSTSWVNTEFRHDVFGNQFNTGISYIRRF